MGRSIVLFGPDFSHERFACANIEPDHHIVKYILLQKPPKFVVYVFVVEMRFTNVFQINLSTTYILKPFPQCPISGGRPPRYGPDRMDAEH